MTSPDANRSASAVPTAEDLRALTWLHKEVQRSMEAALKAVQRHLREALALRGSDVDRVDPSVLRTARSHLHQAAGALELAGHRVPALLVRAGEKAVHRMVQRPTLATSEIAPALERAGLALNEYLERLTVGKPVSGVALFAPYRALMELTDASRIHPADLWDHDWRWRVIASEPRLEAQPADDHSREAMERLILRLMRTPDRSTLHRMSDLCAALAADAKGRRATMWRLAAGFFEAQAAGLLRQDVYVKRAAPRLLAQMRQGMRVGEVSDQLAKDMLFFCACAAQPSPDMQLPRLATVRQAYGLEEGALPDYEAPVLGRVDPAWMAMGRKRLAAARDAWSAVAAGEGGRQQGLSDVFSLVQDSLEKLYPNGQGLGQALVRAAQAAATLESVPAPLAMEVATAILYLEASLEDGELDEAGLPDRIQRMAQRIDAARQGQAPQPPEAWMETLYRRVSDSHTMKTVVQELRSTLGEVEKHIDGYVRNPQLRGQLLAVPTLLGSMRGVLSVLGLEPATQALLRMRDDVDVLAHQVATGPEAAQRDQQIFDRLADNLGALGFMVDILAVQPLLAKAMFRFDPQAGVLHAPTPQPARHPRFGDSIPDSQPGALAELSPAPAAVDTPLAPVPLPVQPPAQEADSTLAQPAAPLPDSAAEQAEMLGVFLEEAVEVFQQAREALAELGRADRDPGNDVSPMTAVRRAFHTLKGSARMVGQAELGAAAWACEQLYNARLAHAPSVSPALHRFTQQALDYLEQWTQAIGGKQLGGHEARAVAEAADALRLHERELPVVLPNAMVTSPPVVEPPADEPLAALPGVADEEAPSPAPPPVEPAAVVPDDTQKHIGPLRIEIAMFNIFLNEADELSRQLSTRLEEWATEPSGPPGETVEALAHSLAGNGAAVGFADLATLARSLEHALGRSNEAARVSEGETVLYTEAAVDIRRMLHQFAAGQLATCEPGLVDRLDHHQPVPVPAPVASPPGDEAPTPAPASLGEVEAPGLGRLLPQDDDIDQVDAADEELFPLFSDEAEELLPELQARMRVWLALPADKSAAAACMRTLHTYKGAARLAGAMRQGEMAHRLETAIEHIVARQVLGAEQVEPLLWRIDALEAGYQALREQVAAAAAAAPPPVPERATPPAAAGGPVTAWPAVDSTAPATGIQWSRFLGRDAANPLAEPAAPLVSLGAVRVGAALLDRLVNQAGETSISRTRIESDLVQIKSGLSDLTDNLDRLRRQLRDVEVQAESQISSRLEAAKAAAVDFDPLEMDRYTRVQELTRMMAESVNDVATVQRGLQRALQSSEDQVALQGRLLRAIQDDLLRTRMVEFESLSDRLYRVVRQAAKETGKQVRLDIVGGRIEIDRSVLERMTGPFEHLLRNSMAHGIEQPAQRQAAGKDPTGLIQIQLVPEGNEVAIEFIDDGAGLDLHRIRERATQLGLLPPGAAVSDAQVASLIFASGVSTADRVSEIAGRGVGMDVVRAEVMALGGRIQTASTRGQGMSLRMVLPLTTAVTQVLMVRAGALTVAVPSTLVENVHRETAAAVNLAYRQGYWPQGEERLPFHWLGALLGGDAAGPATGMQVPVVLVRSAAQRVALHVDEVLGNQEVVVKNLGPQLTRLPGLSGITLLASGAIAAIYNPVALVACYGQAARRRVQTLLAHSPAAGPLAVERPQPVPAPLVLVVDDSLTVRRVTQRLLTREGYRVALAKDGQDALERVAEERPQLILSDIEMPRMDGFEFVRRLRADATLAAVPVIMITSRIAQKHRDMAQQLGVRHYLGKPYGEEELLSVVAAYSPPSPAGAESRSAATPPGGTPQPDPGGPWGR